MKQHCLKPGLRTEPFTVSFVFYLPKLLIPNFIHGRTRMNFMQVTSTLSKTVIEKHRKQ